MNIKNKLRKNIIRLLNFFNFHYLFGSTNKFQLRVLIIHSINNKKKFNNLLVHLKQKWEFINPDEFFDCIDKKRNLTKSSLLITFDDGFKDNLEILPILDEFSISALFFVCPALVELQSSSKIYPLLTKKLFRSSLNKDDMKLMNWDDLRFIQSKGHSIGNHSSFHFQINKLTIKELMEDINLSKSLIKKNLKFTKSSQSFSYPFGGSEHIDLESLNSLAINFKYIFSGIRGNNIRNTSKMIFRDSISIHDHLEITDSFLNGSLDLFYRLKSINLSIKNE